MSPRAAGGDGRGSRRRHPTIVDVADRAGVSKSLVSLVLRDAPNVSDEKRAAVTKAAEEIGYRPNAVARSLVRRRSYLIGVMVSDLHNPYFTEVIDGIQEAARGSGYHALFNTGGRAAAGEDEALDTLLQLRTDGIVMAGPVLSSRRIAAVAATVPVVVVAKHSRSPTHDLDHERRSDGRADRRRSSRLSGASAHRARGWRQGRRRRAAPRRVPRRDGSTRVAIVGADRHRSVHRGGGRDGVTTLLGDRRGVTAVFVGNDLAAVGALDAFDDHGLHVPADMSLVGYDNIALAGLGHIDLTTIDQPRRDMGVTAVRLLLERRDEDRRSARHLVVPPSGGPWVDRATRGHKVRLTPQPDV